MSATKTEAWAIKKFDLILTDCIRPTRRLAKQVMQNKKGRLWPTIQKQGYSVVKVSIQENIK